jgi:cell division protein FtsW
MDLIKRIFKRSGVDRWIYIAVTVLLITGVAMIGSASVGLAAKYGSTYATVNMVKQGIFIAIGYICMIFLARTFKSRYVTENRVWILYFVLLALMFACLLWTDTKGSNSWIKLPGGFTIQPMEFMKIGMILFLSVQFGQLPEECVIPKAMSKAKRDKMVNRKMVYCFFIPIIFIFVAFIVGGFVQKDLGSALILGMICLFMFYCTPLKYYSRLKKLSIAVIALAFVAFLLSINFVLKEHQLTRFLIWLNPTSKEYYYGSSFQLANGLVAYATGGLLGKGYGSSVMKFGYVQEASNDFISAIIVEELGVLGFLLLVIVPYCVIIFKMFNYGYKVKETKSKLILYGIGIYFFAHLFINVGGVSGLIPMTGVPLLMVSSGGSSVVASMIAIGIAQSIIAKYNKDKLKEQL